MPRTRRKRASGLPLYMWLKQKGNEPLGAAHVGAVFGAKGFHEGGLLQAHAQAKDQPGSASEGLGYMCAARSAAPAAGPSQCSSLPPC
jgi:hypothetical protein